MKRVPVNYGRNLFILAILLAVLGLILVADISAPQALNRYGDKFYFFRQQLIWFGIGTVVLIIFSKIKYKFWEKIAAPIFFINIAFLILVLIPRFGLYALGARRWFSVGSVNFQPSEVIKLSLALYLAKVAAKDKKALSYFLPLILVLGLIMLQPDLGTAMVVALIGFSEIFASNLSLMYFLFSLGIGGILTFALVIFSPYRKDRLLTFFETTRDPLGKGYQIRQILLSLGSGGIFGVGFGASRQKYLFLPEASTDSIFAIIAEELGFFGGLTIISLFAYFMFLGFKIAKKAPDNFSKILAIGITVWIGGQAFLNIASMVSLVPLTGIPLPFISYGGSSLVMVMAACGILLNISKNAKTQN